MYLSAQALRDLMQSPEFKSSASRSGRPIPMPQWINKESNYFSLLNSGSAEILIKALGKDLEGFRIVKSDLNKSQQFRRYTVIYLADRSVHTIELLLYIPHPALLDLAKTESLVEQTQILPLNYESKESVKFDNDSWIYYQIKNGGFSFVLKLPMESMLVVRAKKEATMRDAHELINKINITEIRRLLSS
jgi:hypothetical protein